MKIYICVDRMGTWLSYRPPTWNSYRNWWNATRVLFGVDLVRDILNLTDWPEEGEYLEYDTETETGWIWGVEL